MNLCVSLFALSLISLEPFVRVSPANATEHVVAGQWVRPIPPDCRKTDAVAEHQQWLWFFKCSPLDTWHFAVQNWPRCRTLSPPIPDTPRNGTNTTVTPLDPPNEDGGTLHRVLLLWKLLAIFALPPLCIVACVLLHRKYPRLCSHVRQRVRRHRFMDDGYTDIGLSVLDRGTSDVEFTYL
jgi:hypothetical protein